MSPSVIPHQVESDPDAKSVANVAVEGAVATREGVVAAGEGTIAATEDGTPAVGEGATAVEEGAIATEEGTTTAASPRESRDAATTKAPETAAHTVTSHRQDTTPPVSPTASPPAPCSPSPPPPPPKDDKFGSAPVPALTGSEDDAAEGSQHEIQTIMEQFASSQSPGTDEAMSPRLELAGPLLGSPSVVFPPRRSSLVPVDKPLPIPRDDTHDDTHDATDDDTRDATHSDGHNDHSGPNHHQDREDHDAATIPSSPPPRKSSLYHVGPDPDPASPRAPASHYTPVAPAPAPEPEPDLPFDFHRFLEQLRHRSADPVAKFLRSFLLEFSKKQWMVHEQVKIIGDFLDFISKKMAQCDVWRSVSDAEFDNAREGMEKLVMNRLYTQTFSPAIPPPEPTSPRKTRRRQEPPGPGRRGQHQEDVERDEVLAQKVRIYQWVNESHLDIKPIGDKGRKFLYLAQQELLKIKSYRAPRDKIICILNCCKVIFGYLRTSGADQSADAFVPLLIFTVLQANPDHLVSNVQYILRFRSQDKLGGEAGYYISSLMGAVQFIEGLDKTSLTVTDEEFDKNVEAAVSAIAERHALEEASSSSTSHTPRNAALLPPIQHSIPQPNSSNHKRMPSPHYHHIPEKATALRPEVTPRNSMDAERAGPRHSTSPKDKGRDNQQPDEENAAVAGLLKTIQRPLSTIGRIFSDTDTSRPSTATATSSTGPALTPQPNDNIAGPPTESPLPEKPNSHSDEQIPSQPHHQRHPSHSNSRLAPAESAARQASAELEQARRIQRQEHTVVVETLAGMFPQLEREVIDDVVRLKQGRVGLAVDACLTLANP